MPHPNPFLNSSNETEFDAKDSRYLEAAEGWLGLSNWHEANEELECISPEKRSHPYVLCLRWQICAKAEKWELGAEVARAISERVPEIDYGFVHMAYALHEMKRTREAMDVLLPVVDKFPDNYTILYNLACYACQLGKLKDAQDWLEKAIDLAGKEDVRKMALDDPDLEPLWLNIGEI